MEINWAFFQTAPLWQIILVIAEVIGFIWLISIGIRVLYNMATYKREDDE